MRPAAAPAEAPPPPAPPAPQQQQHYRKTKRAMSEQQQSMSYARQRQLQRPDRLGELPPDEEPVRPSCPLSVADLDTRAFSVGSPIKSSG